VETFKVFRQKQLNPIQAAFIKDKITETVERATSPIKSVAPPEQERSTPAPRARTSKRNYSELSEDEADFMPSSRTSQRAQNYYPTSDPEVQFLSEGALL
jgi:hypothetical protein